MNTFLGMRMLDDTRQNHISVFFQLFMSFVERKLLLEIILLNIW